MRVISFIDQPEVIRKILQHLGLWEESQAPPDRDLVKREITFDPSYSQLIKSLLTSIRRKCPPLPPNRVYDKFVGGKN